jgi:hypothetical protein
MEWSSVIAGLVLFWPACILLFLLGFCCIVFALVLVGSTALLVGVFLYGVYSILRDLGLLNTVFARLGKLTNYLSDHVKDNVKQSFVFENYGKVHEKGPALFVCHPHGLYGLTWFIHFATCLSEWPFEKRPVLAVHSIFFQIPILRELFVQHGCIEAKESEIKRCLQEGTSVALLVGGIEELLLTQSETLKLVLNKREGFVRIAKEVGCPLIPLVSPNENNLFTMLDNPVWNTFQSFVHKTFKIVIPLPSFQNLSSWIMLAYKPFSKPLPTYILKPVYPDTKSHQDIKSEYSQRLKTFSKQSGISMEFLG